MTPPNKKRIKRVMYHLMELVKDIQEMPPEDRAELVDSLNAPHAFVAAEIIALISGKSSTHAEAPNGSRG